jgi:hypothetical protein
MRTCSKDIYLKCDGGLTIELYKSSNLDKIIVTKS